jgi:hypothetical protein
MRCIALINYGAVSSALACPCMTLSQGRISAELRAVLAATASTTPSGTTQIAVRGSNQGGVHLPSSIETAIWKSGNLAA